MIAEPGDASTGKIVYTEGMAPDKTRSFQGIISCFLILVIPAITASCGRLQDRELSIPGLSYVSPESELVRLARQTYYSIPGVEGPLESSPKPVKLKADWRDYSGGAPSRLSILLTDPRSTWLGLAHGFKSIGIPFSITDSWDEALAHRVVILYPDLPKDTDETTLRRLEDHVSRGGTLLATFTRQGSPGMERLFGFKGSDRSWERTEVDYLDSEYVEDFAYPEDRRIRINNPVSRRFRMRTLAFRAPREVIGAYDDGGAAIIRNRIGEGIAIAFGWDLGRYIKRAQNNRDHEANRTYVNDYEPSIDTVLRFIMAVYRKYEPLAVTIHPAPDAQPLSVIITHDVDFAGSLKNSLEYARFQRSAGYGATYFLQTKYFQDFFDEMFFDEHTPALLAELEALGMELASHSVSHSDMFARLPQGTFREAYPRYQPRIIEFNFTRNATIMGELRVSKFLIERLSQSTVVSFRPGFLANPFSLPQSLESAGYRFSSAVTANDVMTHLPFRQTFDRLYGGETGIFEFPITVEDEKDPPMDARLDKAFALAEKISRYGGLYVVLIHPNVTAEKYRFLQGLTEGLRDKAWWGTMEEFGAWWSARDRVEIDVLPSPEGYLLVVRAALPISGLTLHLPPGFEAAPREGGARPSSKGPFTVMDVPAGTSEFSLRPLVETQGEGLLLP